MKLKSLEISGFKSFADKTKIEFKPGMTGIVGPNGSGKSNIIEAIRWVMGEQSAKGLRGEKMQDVIFGGTSTRSPLNRAEVTIIFDNSDHYLKTDFTEIRISRRLYRSGESNYLINGQDVRLRDIVDLFTDTGLGRESFSIISQGRVEAIFNSKSEDRRAIIEEVAGVYKYKQNKEHAQKELKQTQENLDRVQDILQEVASRVEPLKQQAAVAQDYLIQKEQYDALEKSRLVIEIDEYKTNSKTLADKLANLNEALTVQKTKADNKTNQLAELKQQHTQADAQRDTLQATLVTLAQTKERLHGLQNISVEREKNRTATVAELTHNQQENAQAILILEANLQAKVNVLAQKETEIQSIDSELAELTKQTVASRIEQLQQQITVLETNNLVNIKKHANLQNDIRNMTLSLSHVSTTHTDLDEQILATKEQLAKVKIEKQMLVTQLEDTKQAQVQVQSEFEQLTQQYQSIHTEHKQSQQAWFDGLALVKQAQARLESLQTLNNEYAGYYQGVRNLMIRRDTFSGLAGVVADLITVPTKVSKAIEIALGSAVQHVIVDNEQTAKAAVKMLTQQKLGRVTFLPLTTIKSRFLQPQQIESIKQVPGFVGIASDLVAGEAKYQTIINYLLGTTVIASDIDTATEIANVGHHRLKIVTIDGQVINPGGSITGGAQKRDNQGVLQQKVEIDSLTQALAKMNAELMRNEEKVKTLADKINLLTDRGTEKRNELATCNEKIQILNSKSNLLAEKFNDVNQQLAKLKTQRENIVESRADVIEQKSANEQALADLVRLMAQEEAQIKADKAKIISLTQNQNSLSDQIAQKREWLAGQRAMVTAMINEKNTLEQQLVDLKVNQGQVEKRLKVFSASDEQLLQANLEAQAKLKITESDYVLAEAQLEKVKQVLGVKLAAINKLEQDIKHYQLSNQELADEISTLRTNHVRLTTLLEQAQAKLTLEYGLTVEAAKISLITLPINEIKTQLKLIKRGLDELGDVNLSAIAEYQEVAERFEFLNTQQNDLITARDNLFVTMNEMDAEVKTRFKLTFDAIAAQFSRIFSQMFGGGKAELKLTDPEHILTTGIDIMAQPPGKKFQQMSLLSGGEKALTAITLLFAILAVRPVPFAILDETEAALDDANVTRFAEYLKNFQNDTQFIVITHRKGTMVNADMLYGITMQESGISKMVAVNLADIQV